MNGVAALRNRSAQALFLAYHSISPTGPPFLSLPPELFEVQLRVLRKRGYRSGTLSDLGALAAGATLDGPRVFLTFDDGYADNAAAALPLMLEHGFGGLFFVIPPRVDEAAPFDWDGVAESCLRYPDVMRSMDWAAVERMVENGMEIGSHTMGHPRLSRLADDQLAQELLDSRRRIAERLGSCDALAYPYGDWSPRVARVAGAAGYRFAMTLPAGGQTAATPLTVPRVAVDARDNRARFALKISPLGRGLLLSRAKPALRRLRGRR